MLGDENMATQDDSSRLRLDEAGRLAALRRLNVLDSGPEEAFENIVSLIRTVLRVPMAAVTLLDENRQWFKARRGIDASETPRDVSFCTHVIQQGQPMVITDARLDPRFADNPAVTGEMGIRSYLGIPLQCSDGYNLGALCAVDTVPRDFTLSEMDLLSSFAQIVTSELELRRVAQYDTLTGALTRRAFLDRVGEELERYHRYGCPGTLVLIDIDHFKAVNDTHGHPAGDAVLREVVASLKRNKRPSDVLGRLGGEEFAMLLPETGVPGALLAAERLRTAVAESPVELASGATIPVTASFGIAGLNPDILAPEQWLACADVPLYQAKRSGRNACRAVE